MTTPTPHLEPAVTPPVTAASRHFTASAVVIDPARRLVLLIDHKLTGRRQFPGGHVVRLGVRRVRPAVGPTRPALGHPGRRPHHRDGVMTAPTRPTMAVPTTLTGLLTATLGVLARQGLGQGDYADPDTGCVCPIGAVRLAAGGEQDGPHIDPPADPAAAALVDDAIVLLAHYLPADQELFAPADAPDRVAVWADQPDRRLDDVLALLDTTLTDVNAGAAAQAGPGWTGRPTFPGLPPAAALTLTVLREHDGGHVIDLNGREVPLWVLVAGSEPVTVLIGAHQIGDPLARQLAAAYLEHLDGHTNPAGELAEDLDGCDVYAAWGRWRGQTDEEKANADLHPDDWDPDGAMWEPTGPAVDGALPVTVVDVRG